MLGKMNTNHIAVNNYYVEVVGAFTLYATTVSGVEQESVTMEMPDRTVVSAGVRKATEVTIGIPMHHQEEQNAMELWWKSATDPVTADYKKEVVIQHQAIGGSETLRQYTLSGVFPKSRKLPDLDLADDGALAIVEWTLSVDDVSPA